MKYNAYALKFNNYYNRIVKKFESLDDYLEYQVGESANDITPNFSNGIQLTLVLNYVDEYEFPDYLVLTDSTGEIDSRWFVMSRNKLSVKQYSFELKRDVLADNIDELLDSPMMIKKGTLPESDNMIFNKDGAGFNQIKKSEVLLKDETKTPWIVGYIPRDSFETATEITAKFTNKNADITIDSISNYVNYEKKLIAEYSSDQNINYGIHFDLKVNNSRTDEIYWRGYFKDLGSQRVDDLSNSTSTVVEKGQLLTRSSGGYSGGLGINSRATATLSNEVENDFLIKCFDGFPKITESPYLRSLIRKQRIIIDGERWTDSDILEYNSVNFPDENKRILDESNGIIYQIKVEKKNITNTTFIDGELFTYIKNNIDTDPSSNYLEVTGTLDKTNCILYSKLTTYEYKFIQLETEISTTIPSSDDRTSLSDSIYDMFCMPYYDSIINIEGQDVQVLGKASLAIAQAITTNSGSNDLYDLQLLPFCPVREYLDDRGIVKVINENTNYNIVRGTADNIISTVMIWGSVSEFNFKIAESIEVTNLKETNDLDMYRICSPNYSSVFEFNPAKNRGVDYIDVVCNYRPYSPYVKISPNFKALYGSDFNDSRGLILGGDYRITTITDAFAEYESTNLNYQNIFDRQIDTLELQNKWAGINDIAGAITGTAQGALSGGMSGALMGNLPGAIGGAIGGSVASLAGGVVDVYSQRKLRNDNIDLTKDLFNYNLQNIQAIPNTIATLSAINQDNRLFPFIEYYTCSDEERTAYRNMLKYNGMTVNRVGTLREFIKDEETYIEAMPIRIETINSDFTTVNEIIGELNSGIYTRKGDI